MIFSEKKKKVFNKKIIFNTYTISWKHTIYLFKPYHICLYTSMAHCLLPVLCLFWYSIYCYKKYLDFHIMTCLFSKWVVNNYGKGGGRVRVEIWGVWNILENLNVFKVHGWRQWKCFGYSTWNMLSLILCHENVILCLRNLFMHSRGAMKIYHAL